MIKYITYAHRDDPTGIRYKGPISENPPTWAVDVREEEQSIEEMLPSDAIEYLKKKLGHEAVLIEAINILYEHGLLSDLVSECVEMIKEA